MRCSLCSEDLAHLRAEQEVYAPDGTFATLAPAFCPRCGWPLGHGQAALWPPGGLELAEGRAAELKLILTSDGEGDLFYSIDADPRLRPVSLPLLHGRVPTGQRKEIGFRAESAGDGEPLVLDLFTLTARPDQSGQARTAARDDLWVQQRLTASLSTLRRGPVTADAGHLLFGLGLDERFVELLNWGGVPVEAEFQCSPGYLLCGAPGGGFSSRGNLTLGAGRAQDGGGWRPSITPLRVRSDGAGGALPGELVIRPAGLEALALKLERVVPAPPPLPTERYAVGIDFGTSKTAVAIVDQYQSPPLPNVLTWERSAAGGDPRWLPSAIYYDKQYGQPVFGDAALQQAGAALSDVAVRLSQNGRAETRHGTLFVGMKMALHDEVYDGGELPLRQVVVDFFSHLFEAITARGGIDLSQARVILSLPVLGDATSYQRQESRTVEAAAEAGELFGVTPDRILTEREPVCAAIDLVALQSRTPASEGGQSLHHGDWLCVFDCGAGTTDISLMQVAQQDAEWRFQAIHPLGYEWGGDSVDYWIFLYLLGRWCSPDDPGHIADSGPVGIQPAGETPEEDKPAIDLDRGTPSAPPVDWTQRMLAQTAYRFDGASQPVSKAELLGHIRSFKERYLSALSARTGEGLTTGDPVADLAPSKLGSGQHWRPLSLSDLANQLALEFQNMRGGDGEPLRVTLPRLWRSLRMIRPNHVCPVGGGTLVSGWREAIEREPLGMRGILEGDPDLRRLHVARGAAQKTLFRVIAPLPEDARLEILAGRPGELGTLVAEPRLAAGSPPGEAQQAEAVANLPLQTDSGLLLKLWLGQRLLMQRVLTAAEGRAAMVASGLTQPQAAVRVSLSLAYLRQPNRLCVAARWLLQGEPAALQETAVELPQFEV